MKTALLSLFALIAFAGNSVLCRLALSSNTSPQAIDPASFTSIRLLSGVLMLFVLLGLSRYLDRKSEEPINTLGQSSKGSWLAGLSLFLYAALFSYAYVSLDTATGALILFGTCLLYTSPSPRDLSTSRMPSSA